MFILEGIWRAVAIGLVRVSREEQDTEGLRAVGTETWRKAIPEISLPPAVEVGAWFGVSRCLPFVSFLSAPSSSFWFAMLVLSDHGRERKRA